MITGSLVPASELGADNLKNLSSPLTDILVMVCLIDCEEFEQGSSNSEFVVSEVSDFSSDVELMQPDNCREITSRIVNKVLLLNMLTTA